MKFVIDRSGWRCGAHGPYARGKGVTGLLNDSFYKCCLGFCAEQLGIASEQLRGIGEPCDIEREPGEEPDGVLVFTSDGYGYHNTELTNSAISINDSDNLDDKEREQSLIALFAKHGHEIEFMGEYQPYECVDD